MDSNQFDNLAKALSGAPSRRGVMRVIGGGLAALTTTLAIGDSEAKRKKKKKKKKKGERCGATTCGNGQLCCDDANGTCCNKGGECCNPGPGTGTCCDAPNRCGGPYGDDAAPRECCPPERQWTSTTGLIRCCPPGTKSMGSGITSNGGPCCPDAAACGDNCCASGFCSACVGGTCQYTCGHCEYCAVGGVCKSCGEFCCGGRLPADAVRGPE